MYRHRYLQEDKERQSMHAVLRLKYTKLCQLTRSGTIGSSFCRMASAFAAMVPISCWL